MCDHLAHRYFDTAHAILQATVDEDLPDLEPAVQALARSLEETNPGPKPRYDLTQRYDTSGAFPRASRRSAWLFARNFFAWRCGRSG
jgi:hypothetical protein